MPLLIPVQSYKESQRLIAKARAKRQLELEAEEKETETKTNIISNEPTKPFPTPSQVKRKTVRQEIEEKYNKIFGRHDINTKNGSFTTRRGNQYSLTKGRGREVNSYRIYEISKNRSKLICKIHPLNLLNGEYRTFVKKKAGKKQTAILELDVTMRPLLDRNGMSASGRKMQYPSEMIIVSRGVRLEKRK